jgi:hypothetical protein
MPIHDDNIVYEKGIPNITFNTYSKIFTSNQLWDSFPLAKYIAIFQKDCFMYKMFPKEYYENYAFVGANWFTPRHVAPKYGGINGGFSIRSRQATLDCINQCTWDDISDYRKKNNMVELDRNAEDIFFTHACEILNLPTLPIQQRPALAIEAEYYTHTCVYHGWTKNYHDNDKALAILRSANFPIPESMIYKEPTYSTDFSSSMPAPFASGILKSSPEVSVDLDD